MVHNSPGYGTLLHIERTSRLQAIITVAALTIVLGGMITTGALIVHYSPHQEYGPVLHEPATVIETIYSPPASHHRSGYVPTINHKGEMKLRYREWTDNTPAIYGVVFKCQHGQFVSQGSDQRHKDLWKRLPKYSQVDVSYREVFRVHHDGNREIIDLDFLDAVVTAKQGPAEEQK